MLTLRLTTVVLESSLPRQSRRGGEKENSVIPATPKSKTDGAGLAAGGAEELGAIHERSTPSRGVLAPIQKVLRRLSVRARGKDRENGPEAGERQTLVRMWREAGSPHVSPHRQ